MSVLTAQSVIYAAEVGIVEIADDALPVAYSGSITPSAISQSITIETGLNVLAGDEILIETATGTSYVLTRVVSYDSGTGALVTAAGAVFGGSVATSWTVRRAPLRIASVAFTSTTGTYAPAPYVSGLKDPPEAAVSARQDAPDGQRFFGVIVPKFAPLAWVNGGSWDFLRNFTAENQRVALYRVPVEQRSDGAWVAKDRAAWVEVQVGQGIKMLTTQDEVTVSVGDLTEHFASPIQRRKFEGLGGCITGNASGYAAAPNTASLLPPAGDFTLAAVVRASTADLAADRQFVGWTGAAGHSYRVRCNGGNFQLRVDLDNGTPLSVINGAVVVAPTVDAWYCLALRWDKSTGIVRWSSKRLDGMDSAWVHTNTTSTAGLDVQQYGAATSLDFLTSSSDGSMIADCRVWSRYLEDSELEDTIRDLDLEVAADVLDLEHWWSFDERYGEFAVDLIAGDDAALTDPLIWDTTGTGRPEQRGTYRPIAFGACWAPLIQVDELTDGRIYAVSCREVDDVVFVVSRGVALTPTLTVAAAVATFNVTDRTIRDVTPPGPFLPFVPDMTFDFVGSAPNARNDGSYVVDGALVSRDRFVVVAMTGSIPTSGSYTGTYTATSPEWEIYRPGSDDEPTLIRILSNADGPFHAYVSGDVGSIHGPAQGLSQILQHALVDHGKPGITSAQIDVTGIDSGLLNAVVGFSVGTEKVTTRDVCELLMASCAGVLYATATEITATTIPLGTAIVGAPDEELSAVTEIENLPVAIPSEIPVGHSPVRDPLSNPLAAAWQKYLPAFSLPEQLRTVPMPAWVLKDLPNSAPSDVIHTALRGDKALARLGELLKAGFFAESYEVAFGVGGESLTFGSTAGVTFPRFAFDDGRSAYVVGWRRNSGRSRATTLTIAVPRGIA